jgi:hypothetical protein
MTTITAQGYLFQRIREKLPLQDSLADTISEILHVSSDSAYRRIRGETLLLFDEAIVLCKHFNLSLDQLAETKSSDVLFHNVHIRNGDYTYRQFLEGLKARMASLANVSHKEVVYMSKDLPIFHNFYFRPLIAFRYFFWMKSHLLHPDFEKKQFHFDVLPPEIEILSTELTRAYCGIPSVEMWNTESINSTISQIEFSRDSGHFTSAADIATVYTALEDSIQHMKIQAEHGCKFMPGEDPAGRKPNFKFFFNRVVLGDNTIMVTAGAARSVFINYGHLNYIETTDENFCNDQFRDFENLIRRSTQISQSSEKQRNIFFNILLTKIQDRKRNLRS